MNDTHPDVEQRQIELLAKAGPARRLALVRSLSQTATEISSRAIGRRYPHLSPEQRAVKLIALCHGEDLAQRLDEYMARKGVS